MTGPLYPWSIVQPICWCSKTKRFLFFWWITERKALMKNVLTGECVYRPISAEALERNCYD